MKMNLEEARNSERGKMKMKEDELRRRTKAFALRLINLANALPEDALGRILKSQLLRSGTSVGANYRAAKRAKSTADFINKMGTVEEEADESMYWMELIVEAGLMEEKRISALYLEADEILSMVVASIKTARRRRNLEKGTGNAEVGTRKPER
jgi:four helix bundle protein